MADKSKNEELKLLEEEQREEYDMAKVFFEQVNKLTKAISTYDENHNSVQQALSRVMKMVEEKVTKKITVSITPVGPQCQEILLSDEEESPGSFYFQVFYDGVREITILPTIAEAEFFTFSKVLITDTSESQEDLVTLLWIQDFPNIDFFSVTSLDDRDKSKESSLENKGLDIFSLDFDSLPEWLGAEKGGRVNEFWSIEQSRSFVPDLFPGQEQSFFLRTLNQFDNEEEISIISNRIANAILRESQKGQRKEFAVWTLEIITLYKDNPAFYSSVVNKIFDETFSHYIFNSLHRHSETWLQGMPLLLEQESFLKLLDQFWDEITDLDLWKGIFKALVNSSNNVKPFLHKTFVSTHPERVTICFDHLEQHLDEHSLELLILTSPNKDASIRERTVDALSKYIEDVPQKILFTLCQDDKDPVSLKALELLRQIPSLDVGKFLMKRIKEGGFEKLAQSRQKKIFFVLGHCRGSSIFGYLSELSNMKTRIGSSKDLQLLVIDATLAMNSNEAKQLLKNMSKGWFIHSDVKKEAQKALKRIK